MAAHDQLEVIDPSGEIRFIDLDPNRGVTNIGSHPENDVVLDSPDVAQFHAILDHRQKPYQLVVFGTEGHTLIGGVAVTPNTPYPLTHWDTVELDGHSLVLMDGGSGGPTATATVPTRALTPAMAAVPAALAGTALAATLPSMPMGGAGTAVRLGSLPPDHIDDFITTEINPREWVIDCGQTATGTLTIGNGGDLVATFDIHIDGIDPAWIEITPPAVNLFEGEQAQVTFAITPPRAPSSRAGTRYLGVVVTSPNYSGRSSTLGATLVVNPYYEYSVGDLSPRQQTLPYRKKVGQSALPVINQGNSESTYRLDAEDDERGVRFEFMLPGQAGSQLSHAELKLQPEEAAPVTMRITPNKRQFFGVAKHNFMYTVTATPLSGVQTPRSVLGQVATRPLVGPWVIALAVLLLAFVLVLIFRPTISYFGTDPNMKVSNTGEVIVNPGEPVTLYWRASRFAALRITSDTPQDTAAGPVDGPEGSKVFNPEISVVYTLHAENLLTRLQERLFGPTRPVTLKVNAIRPVIVFTLVAENAQQDGNTFTVVRGQTVTLQWKVDGAHEVFLSTNGALETIPPERYVGSVTVKPDIQTEYSIIAHNNFTPPEGDIAKLTVKLVEPPPTPRPIPVIQRFDALPVVITQGESVRLDWVVTGVTLVTISGVPGEFGPTGSVEVVPPAAGPNIYTLSANNGGSPVSLDRTVQVNEAPPPAVPPVIEFFTAIPAQVVAGDPAANQIQLAWRVTGDTTNVQISASAADFAPIANLPKEGTFTVAAAKTTLFVLTAFNGEDKSTTKTLEITVLVPTPTPTPPPPLPFVVFSAVAGDDAHPEPPGNVLAITNGVPTNTRQYEVVSGTWVKFSWQTNAASVSFLGSDQSPLAGSTSLPINTSATYPFVATNATGGSTTLFIVVVKLPKPVPPAPFNLNGPAISATGPFTLTWAYNNASLPAITSFKIYRANLPDTNFSPIQAGIAKALPHTYTDPDGTCDMAYYVVAEYTDEDLLLESPASLNSWYSQPCPTATPEP